jgi:hypothetical protein
MGKRTFWGVALFFEVAALMLCAGRDHPVLGQGGTPKESPQVETKEAPARKVVDLPKPDADGFIAMFNGKDLTNWEGLEDVWKVRDGAIEGTQIGKTSKQTFLIFSPSRADTKKFANFELRLKFKWIDTKNGYSGVQIRSKIINEKIFQLAGYQADLDTAHQYTGVIYNEENGAGKGKGRTGVLARRGEKVKLDAADKRSVEALSKSSKELAKAVKLQDWNEYIILADGPHLSTTINGELMTDLVDESPQAVKEGMIGLQMHITNTQTIQFKDIKIKLLK